MAWADCQAYMRAINALRKELNKELDNVQQNGIPREETIDAALKFEAARWTYWYTVNKENNDSLAPAPIFPLKFNDLETDAPQGLDSA